MGRLFLLTTCLGGARTTACHLFSTSTSWTPVLGGQRWRLALAAVVAECLIVAKVLTETLSMGMHIHNLYQNDN